MPDSPFQELPAPSRDERGRFLAGNMAALRHGMFSRLASGRLPVSCPPEVRDEVDRREAAIVADLGGAPDLSALTRDLVRRYVTLQLVEEWLSDDIVANGALSPKGQQRAALSALLSIVDRQTRTAQLLGLQRRAAQVPHVDDYLAGRVMP